MPKFDAFSLLPQEQALLLEWAENEGLNPNDILNDGSFSVHEGWVSGNLLVRGADGKVLTNRAKTQVVTRHFKVRQKHPLPDTLANGRF